MNTDLEALLAVQAEDEGIRALDERAAELDARERALDDERRVAVDAADRARAVLEREGGRRGALAERVAHHRQLHERNVAQMDQVRKLREATAARAQIDMAQQILQDEERELQALDRRSADLRSALEAHEATVGEVEEAQRDERARVAADREALEGERRAAREHRDGTASRVPRQLLTRYERIRDRRGGQALYPLRGLACGSCDTAIPLQRRSQMANGARIEVCEVCGVLLYASPE
ncbi:MAG TPA: hypothetical protein VGE02_02790 [Gemmatimonadales bacterium]